MPRNLIIIYQAINSMMFESQSVIYCQKDKEISMQSQHPVLDTLEKLKSVVEQEGNNPKVHQQLALLEAQLPTFFKHCSHLEEQLTQKTTELKQTTRRFKKISTKLNKKTEECHQLKNEMQRVNKNYSLKVEKLAKYQEEEWAFQKQEQTNIGKNKPRRCISTSVQCEMLSSTAIKELQLQNELLKERLEHTQKMLFQEKQLNRALALKLQETTSSQNSHELEEVKDNSTIDADSLKGDPFQGQEEDWFYEEESEKMEKVEQPSWWKRLWASTWGVCKKIVPNQ